MMEDMNRYADVDDGGHVEDVSRYADMMMEDVSRYTDVDDAGCEQVRWRG
jgi:hypothetical protein